MHDEKPSTPRCPQCGAALTRTSCPRCALALATEELGFDEDELHLHFPELDIVGKIARGGFGTVYRAEHRKLKRPVALKFLDPNIAVSKGGVARFEEEMAAIGKLDHPGIVRAYDAGEREGHWYIMMEYVDGENLATLSRRVGKMEVGEACRIVWQAALALAYAHEHGLVHRDVKPGNIMVATVGSNPVKVLDFGLVASAQKSEDSFSGSPDYAAPEQITTPRDVDARADIFGLGATLFRLLTGVPPRSLGGENSVSARIERIASMEVPPVATLRPDLPAGIAALCDRMLAMNRDDRPASAAEVADLLEPFFQKAPRRRLWPIAASIAALATAGWLAFPKSEPPKLPTPEPPPDMQSAVVKRRFKDTGHGLYFFNGTPIGVQGTITGWTIFDERGGPQSVTPLLLDRVDEQTFTLQGVGTSRRSDGSGVQTFAFELLAGTDKVGPNTCFGFCDQLVTKGLEAGTADFVADNSGVVDAAEDGGPWLFTPGSRTVKTAPTRIGMRFALLPGRFPTKDGPLPVEAGRTYSARAVVTAPGETSPIPPSPKVPILPDDTLDDDLPPLRDQIPQAIAAQAPSQPGVFVIDDSFDDGMVGTNTNGKGDGFTDIGVGTVKEAGGLLLLDSPGGNNTMAFRSDRSNSLNPFQPTATRLTYTFGKITRSSGRQRLWIGYHPHQMKTTYFFPGPRDPSKRHPGKGLYLSIISQNRSEDAFANRGNLVATDAAGNPTILASWKWADPDELSGLVVRLTTTDKTYRIEFSGAAGGVPVFATGGPTGAISGLGEPQQGESFAFGGMNQFFNGSPGAAMLDRVTVELNVPDE